MTALRIIIAIFSISTLLGLISCGLSHDSKIENKGIASDDKVLVEKLEASLKIAGIPYQLSIDDNGLVSFFGRLRTIKKPTQY
ncbi:MAG: hypothetical protein ACI909_001076 [Planctomycetota bacterium]